MRIKPTRGRELRLYTGPRGSYPSVTEILSVIEKRYLDSWRHRVGRKEADRTIADAKVFGTKLHTAAQQVAWGERVEGEMEPFAAAVQKFMGKHVLEVLGTELQLVSEKQRFGGTLDLHCQLKDGSYAVVDYKTSAALTREHGLQTAAYALLCREHELRVNRRLVVRIKKDKPGEFYVRTYADHRGDLEAFLALRTYWWWAHSRAMEKSA